MNSDPWIYRLVVGTLGLLVLIVALGVLGLMLFSGKDAPQGFIAFGSAALAGLLGLLAPSPLTKK